MVNISDLFLFADKITWAKGIDENGRPIVNEENRPEIQRGADKGSTVFAVPSFLGAKNWMPMSYSQKLECSMFQQMSGNGYLGIKQLSIKRCCIFRCCI